MDLKTYVDQERGRQTLIAQAVNAQPQLVWQWANVRPVPADRCADVELATDGAVTCEELRPDLQWLRVKDSKWPNPKGRPLLDVARAAA